VAKSGVLPSFWDRLQHRRTSLSKRSISVADFELAVLRDVETLLNERRPIRKGLPEALQGTILAYGLPELTSFDLASTSGADTLALAIEDAIRTFEPRLDNVSVSVASETGYGTFRIRADIIIEPSVERLQFQAVVQPDASTLKIDQLDRLALP